MENKMRFSQFLSEDKSFEGQLRNIKKDCSDMLKNSELPMFRGIHQSTFGVYDAIQNRKPKDSARDYLFNNTFNLAMEKLTGVELIRTKSMFCTSSFSQAASYGMVNFIFPSDGCKYIFSNEIFDSFEDIHFDSKREAQPLIRKSNEIFELLCNGLGYTRDKLIKTIGKNDTASIRKIDDFMGELASIFKQDMGYDIVDDIKPALVKKNHEIVCYGSKKYYFINCKFAAFELKTKNSSNAWFYEEVYKQLLEKINA